MSLSWGSDGDRDAMAEHGSWRDLAKFCGAMAVHLWSVAEEWAEDQFRGWTVYDWALCGLLAILGVGTVWAALDTFLP
jgi:hypothetical protein